MKLKLKRDENGGFVAIEFVGGLGLLVIPTALLCIAMPTWVERESLSRTASREAARTYVLSSNSASGRAQAARSVAQIAANAGLEPGDLTLVGISGDAPGKRNGRATATVRVRIPSLVLPFENQVNAGNFSVTSRHTEPMDLYRSAG